MTCLTKLNHIFAPSLECMQYINFSSCVKICESSKMLCRCVMEVTEAGQMRELSMLSFRPDMDIKTVGWFQDDLQYFI